VDQMPPHFVVTDALLELKRKEDSPTGRIDFRELSPYIIVRKSDVLAVRVPSRAGVSGQTVRGAAIAYSNARAPVLDPGQNTLIHGDLAVAICDGRFRLMADTFWIDEVLEVAGNIDFPGDVRIGGEIRDGFTVSAGGSLVCMESIDASRISCKGDLITNQGIIGRKHAFIKVGGIIRARFVEGCYLEAKDSIHVRTSIMNSVIRTLNRVEMGHNGIIVGGIVYAQNGVRAAQIGTDRGPRAEIHCGIDHTVEQKLTWIRDRNIALATKLKEVEGKMKLSDLRVKIKRAIHQLNESARDLVQSLDRNENAEVSIRETVFPGTYIEICHLSYIVSKQMKCVTFKLDKENGRIVAEGWEKDA
jgi:uncharacterized protein (DUF342 family)